MNQIEKYKLDKENFKVVYDKPLKDMSNDEIDYNIEILMDFKNHGYNLRYVNQYLFILNDYKNKLCRKIKLDKLNGIHRT